jgi:hypothetical protein
VAAIAVVALVVVAAVVLLLVSSHKKHPQASPTVTSTTAVSRTTVPRTSTTTSTTNATETASVQAQKINFLLAQSSNDRDAIVGATNDIANCGNLSQDEATLNNAAQSRQLLINELPDLQISQVPGASQLISTLTSAWQASKASDTSYAAWAGDLLQTGCTPGQGGQGDSNWQAAQASDAQATSAKTQAAALWAPIATSYGLPQYTYNQL